jgi:hypothetical protein
MLVVEPNERERTPMLTSPKGKNRSWSAKNVEELLEARSMMTAWPWDERR